MKIVIYDEKDKEVGRFYIPDDATKEYIERNVPPIIQAIQLITGKIEITDY